ncbi:retropepsin-like aspartic protease [Caulobacter segnis]|uniref:Peptidase A2A n=1 Tax=Caulobacter segnis TaxID=88688 RepID=A0A2W5UXS4_9CAUL|nr:retropepsin-like aspartic protease [Caulobacter segnis]PZR31327.1 MAG: peptidase A2A [Caulobacter segnis]
MLTRRILTAGLGLSMAAPAALAGSVAPMSLSTPQTAGPPATSLEEPLLFVDASVDEDERMTIEVTINGRGPFRFVVDTGAGRSVLTPGLVEQLALPSGPEMIIHGIAGSIVSPTAQVALLRAGEARLADGVLPVLPRERVGADGLLGVDILDGRNVLMDFKKNQLQIRRSRNFSEINRRGGEATIDAGHRFGRLTLAGTRIGGTRATAFIDSGGGVSIGNMALARAIAARRRRSSDFVRPAHLLTADGEVRLAEFRVVPSIEMGALNLTNVPMAFADVHIFDVWSLKAQPAALLGVDILRLFARVELDYGDDKVLFRLGEGGASPRVLTA